MILWQPMHTLCSIILLILLLEFTWPSRVETKSKLFLLGLSVRRALLGGHSERSISSLVVQVCLCIQMKNTYPLPALDGGVTGGICVTSSTLIPSSSSSSRVGSLPWAMACTTKSAATPSRATHQGLIMAPFLCNYLSPFSFHLCNLHDITYRNVVVHQCISGRYHWLKFSD